MTIDIKNKNYKDAINTMTNTSNHKPSRDNTTLTFYPNT